MGVSVPEKMAAAWSSPLDMSPASHKPSTSATFARGDDFDLHDSQVRWFLSFKLFLCQRLDPTPENSRIVQGLAVSASRTYVPAR
jgi:hypothetical protein